MARKSRIMGVVAGAALILVGAAPLSPQLSLQSDSKVWVSGTSTVKSFKCESSAIGATLTSPDAATELNTLVSGAQITVDVARLECGNGTMNEHMRKALKMSTFPKIAFRMDSYTLGADNTVTVRGILTIAGQGRPVELMGTAIEDGSVVRSAATAQINMKEWGVQPPTLMLGSMKVKEMATIGYSITIER
jgi:polyisoprenoid-binding protein YceI